MNKKEAATPVSKQRQVHVVCPHDCPSSCALEVEVIDGARRYRLAQPDATP